MTTPPPFDSALAQSAALLAGIVQLASEGIVSVDAEERIHLFNRGAEEIFGYTAAEVLGQPLELLIPERYRPQHHAEHLPYFAKAHEASRRMGERREVFGRRKSGEEFPAEVSISRVDVDGRRMYNAVVRDVTERKRAEAALRAHGEALARSNAELEQFAYVASHDLQEPLRMVASYTQLLARRYEGKLDAQADTYIRFAVDGAQRMQALIHDLLALSRVGTQERALRPVDVSRVMTAVLRWLGRALEESDGRVVVEGALPTVMADAGQLEQLFQNLIANALKFRRPGVPPLVVVSAARVPRVPRTSGADAAPAAGDAAAAAAAAHGADAAATEWRFTVRDNGIGFEPQFAEQIFAVFQRLHTRTEYPGTGVGLAICRKIVERHGGTIWAESAPGEGAAFHFTLPERAA